MIYKPSAKVSNTVISEFADWVKQMKDVMDIQSDPTKGTFALYIKSIHGGMDKGKRKKYVDQLWPAVKSALTG